MSLFNGEDLNGWYTYQKQPEPTSEVPGLNRDDEGNYQEPIGLNKDPLKVFTVAMEDNEPAIRISGEVFGILVTEKEFEDYHLKLEFKWGDEKFPHNLQSLSKQPMDPLNTKVHLFTFNHHKQM